jgi:iron complex transport system substrate-binding protein
MALKYATRFSVDYYQEGHALVTIPECGRFLVIPEGLTAPSGLAKDIVVLQQPIENIYLVASAAMDMFASMDSLDSLRFSGVKASDCYVQDAKAAMERGDILYAGKYSAPDYEQILAENCGLAIENTMIYHTPEVKEKLEKFGIPVLVDYSSYEKEPLGRTEWVRLYGLLTGHEEEAEAAFAAECAAFEAISGAEPTGKTVAFFYITTNGEANVRKSSDYLPKMIELAGGAYIFDDLGDDSSTSTVSMQMEQFYAEAKDADYIIYNSAIDGELFSIEELTGKSPVLKNFKAVQNGNVYCTTKNLYQSSMALGTIMADIHAMLSGEEAMTYLYKLR